MAKGFTISDLDRLVKEGKIRSYQVKGGKKVQPKKKQYQIGGRIVTKFFPTKHEAKNWIVLMLLEWTGKRSLVLHDEYYFLPDRGFRFDWAVPDRMLAIEFEGGIFNEKGGHSSVTGLMRDIDKYNRAAAAGWRLIRLNAENYNSLTEQLQKYDDNN